MEIKKNPKLNLEKQRSTFILIGLVTVLVLVFIAFEWKSPIAQLGDMGMILDTELDEEMIQTQREEEVKPPPPPPPQQIPEELNIVDDEEEVEEELEMEDQEIDDDTEVEVVEIVEEEEEVDEIFSFVIIEDKPEFPGGDAALLNYIGKHTKYPEIAKENGITGRVFVGFVIGKKGEVTNVKVLRSVDPYLDKEAIRVVKSMPRWKPGKQRGKAVKVSYQVPIKFILR